MHGLLGQAVAHLGVKNETKQTTTRSARKEKQKERKSGQKSKKSERKSKKEKDKRVCVDFFATFCEYESMQHVSRAFVCLFVFCKCVWSLCCLLLLV